MATTDDGADAGLVARARNGDRQAFRELVEAHQETLFRLALSFTHAPAEAEDIVQETFLKAYRSLQRFRGEAALSTWLHRIAVHLCLDRARRVGRRGTLTLEEVAEPVDPAAEASPERRVGAGQLRRAIAAAVSRLTPAERSVFALRYEAELSCRDTALALERSEGTVKNLLFRALGKLRRELSAQGFGGPGR